MKKCIKGIAIIMSLSIFTGCGAQAPAADENDANMTQVSELETKNETEIGTTVDEENMTLVSEEEDPEPGYSTDIKEVGTLAQEHHDIYKEDDPDVLLGTADFSWIVVDDSFAGAETINTYLYECEVASEWAMFEDNVRTDEETIVEYEMSYDYNSNVSGIRYFDGTYVSFIQERYEYYGGAHGMPIWTGYVFNLETGERLLLMDILSNTEDELKDIVTKYFGEKIDESPEDFWADAKETVHDTVSLETTDFALTEDGICFYMHPYIISAYAAGFREVTIPYSEFEMKILN